LSIIKIKHNTNNKLIGVFDKKDLNKYKNAYINVYGYKNSDFRVTTL